MIKFDQEWEKKEKKIAVKASLLLKKEAEDMLPVGTIFNSRSPYEGYLEGKFRVDGYRVITGTVWITLRKVDKLGRSNGEPRDYFMYNLCQCAIEKA